MKPAILTTVCALEPLLALGLAACSTSVKIPALGATPDQYPDMNCDVLNAERARLLAVRDDLNTPLLSSNTDEREAQLMQVNGRLYAIAKVQSDKSCPLVANAPPSSVVR
jgi:hypothetical protein